MNKFLIILLILGLAAAEAVSSNQLRIVGTANVHGETDPCG